MKKLLSLSIITITVLIGSSCFQTDPKSPIRLVYSNKVNYEPFIIANDLGYFKESGLNVQINLVPGGIHAAEALITGSADVGAMGDAPAVILVSRQAPVKIVARYGKGEKIHRLLAIDAVKVPEDLEGKRLGIQAGSSTHGGFLLWAESRELKIEDITVVPLHPLDLPEAMQTRQIDAMAGSEPWPTNVENLCGDTVHELADFSGLGNHFPHVLVVTKRLMANHPGAVKKLIYATSKATSFLIEHPEKAAKITSQQIGLSMQNQMRCTSRLNWGVGWDEQDSKSMEITSEYMKRFGKIEHIPDLEAYTDIQTVETNSESSYKNQ